MPQYMLKVFVDSLSAQARRINDEMRNYQRRTVGFVENGSWAPAAARVMRGMFEAAKSKDIAFCENVVTIRSALDAASEAKLAALADELMR